MSEDLIQLATVNIAGIRHYVHIGLRDKFVAGDIVGLRLEPANQFDVKAVEVLWGVDNSHRGIPAKVGYVPSPLNQAIFALIEAGYDIQAEVTENGEERITISLKQSD